MPRYVPLLKKTMPACAPGVTGGVSSAPTIAAWPRGSQTTRSSQMIGAAPQVVAPLGHRGAGGLRPAVDDHARRLALGVGVARRANSECRRRRLDQALS